MIGIRDQLNLVHENCGDEKTAAEMTKEERESKGIHKRLPLDVEMARKYLLEDEKLKQLLGEEAVRVFVRVNEVSYLCYHHQYVWQVPRELKLTQNYSGSWTGD